ILDNPALAGMAPYERGWVLTVEPADILTLSRELLFARSAKEWLKHEFIRFFYMIRNKTEIDLPLDMPIPKDFAGTVDSDTWKKIRKTFFTRKTKKKQVKLYGIRGKA
ncbi:MAG: hypothetical protein KKH68_00815, partial [Proteobacteria bacterium]|nr:hypothetical protein [Pseudomonadota bacterium]